MKLKLLKKLGQAVFGVAKPEEPTTAAPVVAADPGKAKAPLVSDDYVKQLRKLLNRRAPRRGRNQFADKRMTRGVQRALEAKQRPRRLAFIFNSMRQANETAKARRVDYVKRRTERWRSLVTATLPRMFMQAMGAHGFNMAAPDDPKEFAGGGSLEGKPNAFA